MLRNECLKKSYNDRLYYYPHKNVGIFYESCAATFGHSHLQRKPPMNTQQYRLHKKLKEIRFQNEKGTGVSIATQCTPDILVDAGLFSEYLFM